MDGGQVGLETFWLIVASGGNPAEVSLAARKAHESRDGPMKVLRE